MCKLHKVFFTYPSGYVLSQVEISGVFVVGRPLSPSLVNLLLIPFVLALFLGHALFLRTQYALLIFSSMNGEF